MKRNLNRDRSSQTRGKTKKKGANASPRVKGENKGVENDRGNCLGSSENPQKEKNRKNG